MPATNIQLEIEQRAGPKGQAGVAFLRFVAVSGDNGTDEQRLTAMPDDRTGAAGGGGKE